MFFNLLYYISIRTLLLQSFKTIDRKKLQLVGVAAMFIASKYEEMYSPDISDFVYITDQAYTKLDILEMELIIVKILDYSFGRPLPLHFLRRYSKAGKVHTNTFAETFKLPFLHLYHYKLYIIVDIAYIIIFLYHLLYHLSLNYIIYFKALPIHHTMAKYFLEQSLVHYEMCHYPPSLIAAAALYLAFL